MTDELIPTPGEPEPPYKVGYKRPPKATQFKPGECPNRKGRPKGSRSFTNELQDELKAQVAVTAGGKRKKVSMRRASAKQVALKAASGDLKAIAVVREEDIRFQERQMAAGSSSKELAGDDEIVMANIMERIRRRASAPMLSGTPGSPEASQDGPKPENQGDKT